MSERVQQRWGICSLVSLLRRSFLILVGGTCLNFLDNNSPCHAYGTALMVAKDFCLNVFLRPLKLLAVAPLKLGLYLPKGDNFCFL